MTFFATIKNLALRVGGQAIPKQPPSSDTATEQALKGLPAAFTKIHERLAIIVKPEPVSGTIKWRFNCEFKCRACGCSVVHLPKNYTDESIASCEACGVEFGPFGNIKLLAQLFVNVDWEKHGRPLKETVECVYWVEGPPAPPQSRAIVSGDGAYNFEVVGESHYQANLESIVDGRTEDGANYECVAILTPEHDNPYDPQAVCVNVNGRKVGHLPQDWAPKFNVALASNGYAQAACNALIVGGWDRGGNDRGYFGIKLDIALPFDLKPIAP
jgi:hypothetical protein